MVTVSTTEDGHQYRTYDFDTNVASDVSTGTYQGVVYTSLYTGSTEAVIRAGYFASRRYNACAVFESLAIDPDESIGTATVTLTLSGCIGSPVLSIKAILDENAPNPSITYPPDNEAKTAASVRIDMKEDANWSPTADYWVPAVTSVVVDVKAILQECVNHSSWQNTGKFVLSIESTLWGGDSHSLEGLNDGTIGIESTENSSGVEASLTYTLTSVPTISSVSGDDIVIADESNIAVAGTNLSGASALRIYKGSNSYPQTIDTNTSTEIQFNIAGNVPVDTGYSLEVTIDQQTITQTIEVKNSTPEGGAGTDNVSTGSILTAVDGHEYVDSGTGFPGTWETQASPTSTTYFSDGLMIGKYDGNIFKASMKLGPITANNSDSLLVAELLLNVLNNYKYNSFRIKAVADPDASDVGAANLISSQALTTAEVSEDNSSWSNVNPYSNWVQTVNPKPINITSVVQEVIDHANWSTGDYIQLIIDYADAGGSQGMTRLYSNDDQAGNASTLYISINDGPSITTVSSDNIIEIGEESCTIAGLNLSSASNLNINKGAISENQTILTNTSTSIVFDVATGAIVPDTGYTIQFDIGGDTYTHTVEFVTGGGVNAGTVSTTADSHEYDPDALPSFFNTGTWEEEETGNLIRIGKESGNYYLASATIGPITAQQGQSFTQADFTWNIPAAGRNYKLVDFYIVAVLDSTSTDFSASNPITTLQTWTTAQVGVQTSTWAGVNSISTWLPGAEVLDITSVVEEVVADSNWTTGNSIQLIFYPYNYPAGSGYATFGSEEGSDNPTFDYATAADTNIANIGGNDIVRTGDLDVVLAGSDMASATALTITDGIYTETQTIKTNTATAITFDFSQGSLAYGSATLTLTVGGTTSTFSMTLSPAADRSHTVIGSTVSTGDASLTYNDNPALVTGDTIEFTKTSANGFAVTIATTGIPTIAGGTDEDTFTARAYDVSTGTWYDDQTITMLESSFFIVNKIPTLDFVQVAGGFVVSDPPFVIDDSGASETWVVQDDSDDTEVWT